MVLVRPLEGPGVAASVAGEGVGEGPGVAASVAGEGVGEGVSVGVGTAEAGTVGDLIAVGLGCAFAEALAARNITVSVAEIPNLREWAMNNLRLPRVPWPQCSPTWPPSRPVPNVAGSRGRLGGRLDDGVGADPGVCPAHGRDRRRILTGSRPEGSSALREPVTRIDSHYDAADRVGLMLGAFGLVTLAASATAALAARFLRATDLPAEPAPLASAVWVDAESGQAHDTLDRLETELPDLLTDWGDESH
jgi:hypothetical protein